MITSLLYGIFYLILGLLSFGLALWSGREVWKAWKGKIPYYINDVALNGKLDSIDAAMLSNLIRLRVVEISEDLKKFSEDLKKTPADQKDILVKLSSSSAERRLEYEKYVKWKFPPLVVLVNQIGDLKLNIAGFDLGSLLISLQNMVTGSRTLRLTVTTSDHYVTVTGDVSIFDPNDPYLTITIPKDRSSGDAFALQIADNTACEILRHQMAKKKPHEPTEQAGKERSVLSDPQEFRTTYFTRMTEIRSRRSPLVQEAKRKIEAQMNYAWDYLQRMYKKAGVAAESPTIPPLKLLPEDMRTAYVDFLYKENKDAQGKAQYDYSNPETVYNAPPMVQFIPDRTFGLMALLFVIKLNNGALIKTWTLAWQNESGAILNSYIDIFGAVVKMKLLGEDKKDTKWPLIQMGGKNWQDGEDLFTLKETELKALRSLQSPGTCGDFQVAKWNLHVEGDDMINDVHQNSGILNKAFYEVSQRIGVEPAAEIWLLGLQKATKELQHKPLEIVSLAKEISSVAGSVAGYSKAEVDEALKSVGLETAEQKEPPLSEQDREQILAISKKNDEAWSKSDAAALAALYTQDAVFLIPGGILSGREAIEKRYQNVFNDFEKRLGTDASPESNHITYVTKHLEMHVVDNNTVWGVGQWSQTLPGPNNTVKEVHGNWGSVHVGVGDTWKTRMLTVNVAPPPPAATATATPSPTTTPSNQ